MKWRKWPEISERHKTNRPAFTERFVFRNDPFSPSRPAPDTREYIVCNSVIRTLLDHACSRLWLNVMSCMLVTPGLLMMVPPGEWCSRLWWNVMICMLVTPGYWWWCHLANGAILKVVFREVYDHENLMNAVRCICWCWNTRGFDEVFRGRFVVGFLGSQRHS